MDASDRKILTQIRADATLSTAEIAERVDLSTTPCWRRIQKLEKSGAIRKRVALLDRAHLNIGMDVFVAIRTNQHNIEWLEKFARSVADFLEVVEFYSHERRDRLPHACNGARHSGLRPLL